MKNKLWNAMWLQDSRFDSIKPINLFHRKTEASKAAPAVSAAHPKKLRNIHFLVRKSFKLETPVAEASIDITADDYYKLYVNNRYVGQGPAPAFHFHYFHNTWDITDFLTTGENVIAIHVYYQGLTNNMWVSGDLRMGAIAEADIRFADSKLRPLHIGTDKSWRAKVSEAWVPAEKIVTIGYDTQVLEDIDSRKFEHGWREPGFNDSAWRHPSAVKPASKDYVFVPQPTPPLQVSTIHPVAIRRIGRKVWQLDFGREITGQFGMQLPGRAGHVVEIRHAEELQPDGRIRHVMRCNCNYSEIWTLSGRRLETLEFYDYKGFRYVEVINPTAPLDSTNTWATIRHYPWPAGTSRFESSSPLLNNIWRICANGVRCNSQEIFVDCPTREKGQYFGDNTVITHAHNYLTGDNLLARKGIEDIASSQKLCPGLYTTAPCSAAHELADYSLQFPMQLERDYLWSGDTAFLRRMLPVAEHVLKYFSKFENRDGILETVSEKGNLVDWPRNLRDGYDFKLDEKEGLQPGAHNVVNAFYIGAIDTVSRLRKHLGLKPLDNAARKQAFVRLFRNRQTGIFVDAPGSKHSALHSNALALRFGLVPQKDKKAVLNFLKEKRIACGVYMSYFLLGGLFLEGEDDFAYDLMTCRDERSWHTMIAAGATACMEAWGPDQKWNTSFCHAWASAPIPMIVEYIMGLTPLAPGWEGVRFNPHTPQKLRSASLKITTPRGPVTVAFKRSAGGKVQYELGLPEGMELRAAPDLLIHRV